MHQKSGAIEACDDPEGNDPRAANGKGHRKAGKNAAEEAQKDDDQADLDAIKSKKHRFCP